MDGCQKGLVGFLGRVQMPSQAETSLLHTKVLGVCQVLQEESMEVSPTLRSEKTWGDEMLGTD